MMIRQQWERSLCVSEKLRVLSSIQIILSQIKICVRRWHGRVEGSSMLVLNEFQKVL